MMTALRSGISLAGYGKGVMIKMQNKNRKGILALTMVTVLSFGVIWGSKALSRDSSENSHIGETAETVWEELDTKRVENIERAVKTENGYIVTVRARGYGGELLMNVFFDREARNIRKTEIIEHNETQGVGSLITEAEFLSQFEGVEAPVYLPGMNLAEITGDGETEKEEPGNRQLYDGTYEAEAENAGTDGFTDIVTMTVEEGKITEVVWDCVDEEGNRKSVLSENGQYVMSKDGLTWKEQAQALGAAVVKNQGLKGLSVNGEGRTDTISGVSISIAGFVSLAENCLTQAAGGETAEDRKELQSGTMVDGISGATISSTAVVTGIHRAYAFLQTVIS